MTDDEKESLLKAREYIVAKSNQIVQKCRYDFTVNEQRTVAYICSLIKPTEGGVPFILDYELNILEYSRICGLQDNGRVYDEVKSLLKRLRDKSMWLTLGDGSETVVGWLDRVTTNKRSGIAKIKIDDRLAPYLFDLQDKFLSYGLKNVLRMKSQYSLRLYELLKSYHDMKLAQTNHKNSEEKKEIIWILELDDLKHKLMADGNKTYANFAEFKRRVLEPAKKEINELTDMNISFCPVLKGRKTIKVKFTIIYKNPIERFITDKKNNEILGVLT